MMAGTKKINVVVFLCILIFSPLSFADDLVFPEKPSVDPVGAWVAFEYDTKSIKSQTVKSVIVRPYFGSEEGAYLLGYQFIDIDNTKTKMQIHRFTWFDYEINPRGDESKGAIGFSIFSPSSINLKYKEKDEWKKEEKFGMTFAEVSFRYYPIGFILLQMDTANIGMIEQGDEMAFQWYILPRAGVKLGNLPGLGFCAALGPEFLYQGEEGEYYDFQAINLGGFLKVWVRGGKFSNFRLLVHGGWTKEGETKRPHYEGTYMGSSIMAVF